MDGIYNIEQEVVTKIIPKKKKCNKVKWLSEKALQIAFTKRQRSKGKIYPISVKSSKE